MKLFPRYLFFLLAFFSVVNVGAVEPYLQKLQTEAHRKKLAQDPYWSKLLHYHPVFFGTMKSDVDGPNFFLSPHGRKNSQTELDATLASFFDPIPSDTDTQHPQCRFPARYAWLKEQLQFTKELPEQSCPRFEAWRNNIGPTSVSLVFASYYMNNPPSMYGHTFLRLGRKGDTGEEHLLDYTVNFAAAGNSNNGILFAVLGLTGGYRGVFSTTPYYMKVQKYNNLESRDLWEYELKVSSAGVDRLIRHLWEMGHTSIAYYFLNKNCSYQLLPMLEVAEPDRQLSSRFRFRAIPLDTLQAVLGEPGFVTKRQYRPSQRQILLWRYSKLNREEISLARAFVEKPNEDIESQLNKLSPSRQAIILDASYDYLRYKTGFYRDQPERVQNVERRILLLRNKIPASENTEKVNVPEPTPPEESHKTARAALGFGANRQTSFEEISFRPALHDLENDPQGFLRGSELEMFSLRVRYDNQRAKANLEEFNMINIKSLYPWEGWVHQPSWKFKFGFDTAHDLNQNSEDSLYFGARGGSGITLALPFFKEGLFYAMVDVAGGLGGIFEDNVRLGVGPSSGVLVALTKKWRVHFVASYIRYEVGDISSVSDLKLIQSFRLTRYTELRATLQRENAYEEALANFNYYY